MIAGSTYSDHFREKISGIKGSGDDFRRTNFDIKDVDR